MRAMGYEGYGLWAMGYGLWAMGSRARGYWAWVMGRGLSTMVTCCTSTPEHVSFRFRFPLSLTRLILSRV